jgi:uncharacterized protein (DUF2236 family)
MKGRLADSFRKIVSGDPKGRPGWVGLIEQGSDVGLYGPESSVWEVHGTVATLIGGIRALLLQAAHPAALAGVKSHSRYETDLMGRLQGTSRWMTITTFASTEIIQREAARVNAMHSKVSGDYVRQDGIEDSYKASDPRFLLWVHCAFTESFIEAHLTCKYPLKYGADAYVKEWSTSALPLGLEKAPESYAELKAEISRFLNEELAYNAATKEVVGFILKPPFGIIARQFYRPLAKTAIRSLGTKERELLRLKQPSKIWELIARSNLYVLSKALGNHSPAHEAAMKRCNELASR